MDFEQPIEKDKLVGAAFDGHLEEVVRLLDAAVDINQDGQFWNPLHAAIENQQLECVRVLIERGADLERRSDLKKTGIDWPPLAHAVDISHDSADQSGKPSGEEPTEIITLLLSAGADPESGLKAAKRYGSTKLIALLSTAKETK